MKPRCLQLLSPLAGMILFGTLLAGCGDDPAPPSIDGLIAEGDMAFARGDAAFQRAYAGGPDAPPDESALANAVGSWREAASAYRDAFRLLDPQPDARPQRAMVAFRIARGLAKAAVHGEPSPIREARADHAMTWLAQAERLAPTMRQVWFERGALHESDVESVRDFMASYRAYTRYLEMVDKAETISDAEQARVAQARAKVAALAPPK